MIRLWGEAVRARFWLISGLMGLLTGSALAMTTPYGWWRTLSTATVGAKGLWRQRDRLRPVTEGADSSMLEARDTDRAVPRCGTEMQLVEGSYCPNLRHPCRVHVSEPPGRCEDFVPVSGCPGPVVGMRFCIDTYEYPNQRGVRPAVMLDFHQASDACAREGKRLCTAREWTLACEGPDWWPHPYGHSRQSERCNVDQLHRFPDAAALYAERTTSKELTRLDQREVSGKRAGCVSLYGVFDLTGNVDEWVVPDGPEHSAGENRSAGLKGGYFGRVRNQCRPTTLAHGPDFRFYQVGFRCCRDVSRPRAASDNNSDGSGSSPAVHPTTKNCGSAVAGLHRFD